jgi:Nucleotidyl transferase AbiEii toxin, Type IV TA system
VRQPCSGYCSAIGFGDAVEPGVTDIAYPVLLDFPVPHLKAYAPETVIAEKFQAMVALGRINSRMKDFLRHLGARPHVPLRRRPASSRHRGNVRSPQHGNPCRATRRSHAVIRR